MLGLGKIERTLSAIAKGEPFTFNYTVYRLFHDGDVIRPKYGYDAEVTSGTTQMMKLESSSRSFAGRRDLSWMDYRWESCSLSFDTIVNAIKNDKLTLGVEAGRDEKRYFAYSGKEPQP